MKMLQRSFAFASLLPCLMALSLTLAHCGGDDAEADAAPGATAGASAQGGAGGGAAGQTGQGTAGTSTAGAPGAAGNGGSKAGSGSGLGGAPFTGGTSGSVGGSGNAGEGGASGEGGAAGQEAGGSGGASAGGAEAGGAGGSEQGGAGGSEQGGAGGAATGGSGGALGDDEGIVLSFEDEKPIDGATVKVIEGAPTTSAMTNAAGRYTLTLAPDLDVVATVDAEGFFPVLRGFRSPADLPSRTWKLPSDQMIADMLAAAGVEQDPAKGLMWFLFSSATVKGFSGSPEAAHGATLTIDPKTNKAVKSTKTLSTDAKTAFLLVTNVVVGKTYVAVTPPPGHGCLVSIPPKGVTIEPNTISTLELDCP